MQLKTLSIKTNTLIGNMLEVIIIIELVALTYYLINN